jgi:hypothetical protein
MKKLFYLLICTLTIFSCIKKPSADFSFSDPTTVSDTIEFLNLSENSKTYEWRFDDGFSSNKKNPSHHFSKPRTYSVTLTVNGDRGSASIIKPINITGTTFSISNFSGIILTSFFTCYWNGTSVEDYVIHGTLYIGSTTEVIIANRTQIYAGFFYDGTDWIIKDPINLKENQHNDFIIGTLNFEGKKSTLINGTTETIVSILKPR